MQDEPKSLGHTNTWTLVEGPKDKKLIPVSWVYM